MDFEFAQQLLISLALGMLISARTPSQRVAMTAVLAGTMLPTVMLGLPVSFLAQPARFSELPSNSERHLLLGTATAPSCQMPAFAAFA